MKKYLKIEKAQLNTLSWRMEMPCGLMLLVGLLAASPLGGMFLNNYTALFANLTGLLAMLNGLMVEKYLYRALMAAGYVVQNKSRILSAIPMALDIIAAAVERVMRVLFGLPEFVIQSIKLIVLNSSQEVRELQSELTVVRFEISGLVQRGLPGVQLFDDVFWRLPPAGLAVV